MLLQKFLTVLVAGFSSTQLNQPASADYFLFSFKANGSKSASPCLNNYFLLYNKV